MILYVQNTSILQFQFSQLWLDSPTGRTNWIGKINKLKRFIFIRVELIIIVYFSPGNFTYTSFGVTQKRVNICIFHNHVFLNVIIRIVNITFLISCIKGCRIRFCPFNIIFDSVRQIRISNERRAK